jgi:hypothetical protein
MTKPSFTVYVDNVGTPHTFIKLDDGNGKMDYFGFAPAAAGSPHGKGHVGEGVATHLKGDPQNKAAGYIDDAGWSKTIAVTEAQHDAMVNAVSVWRAEGHTYNGLATLGGENCTTFVQAVAKAGNITEIVTSRVSLPINLIPADERRSLFTTDTDGRRSISDALRDPLNTPGTPAYEFKQSSPELFKSGPNDMPTPNSTNSLLRQNNDGSFTEVIQQSDGDSSTNEYTSDGVTTSSTQTDGANDDADYASRTVVFDSQGREESRSTTHDDGTLDRIDFDEGNERGDRSIEIRTDAQGKEDWQRITHDDGAVHWRDLDQRGEHAGRIWENMTDAQGKEDWQRITHDDGAVHWRDLDQRGEHAGRIWENMTDAQGKEDWQRITHDDGAVHWRDLDQRGERADRIWENMTDAQGKEDWQRITHDDGAVQVKDFDQASAHPWRFVETRHDSSGRADTRNTESDDGWRESIDFDQDNSQQWRFVEMQYDAQGHEHSRRTMFDDGHESRDDFSGPPPLNSFPSSMPTWTAPATGGSACVTALGGTSCGPRYDVDYGYF